MHLMQNISEWPQRGGANGSVRFYPEITHGANAGKPLVAATCSHLCLVLDVLLLTGSDLYGSASTSPLAKYIVLQYCQGTVSEGVSTCRICRPGRGHFRNAATAIQAALTLCIALGNTIRLACQFPHEWPGTAMLAGSKTAVSLRAAA